MRGAEWVGGYYSQMQDLRIGISREVTRIIKNCEIAKCELYSFLLRFDYEGRALMLYL